MHVYQEPFLFAHTAALFIGMDKSYGEALKAAILVSAAPLCSRVVSCSACKILFSKLDGEEISSWPEQAVQTVSQALVSFGLFRQVCLMLGSDDVSSLRIGAVASALGLIVEKATCYYKRQRSLQIEACKQNNVVEPPNETAKQELHLKEKLKRVETAALVALATAASVALSYPWKVSAAAGVTIAATTLVSSFIQSKWGKSHMFSSLVAIMISGRITGALVSPAQGTFFG